MTCCPSRTRFAPQAVWMLVWVALLASAFGASGFGQAQTVQAGQPPLSATLSAFPLQASAHVRWSEPVNAQVWGLPLQYAHFESDWPLARLGEELSHEQRYFQVLTHLPGQWLLSGQWAGQHWLAQITNDDRGSRGLVSRWQMSALNHETVLTQIFSAAQFGAPLLHVRTEQPGWTVEHAIFHAPASLSDAVQRLTHNLMQQLQRAGWQRHRGQSVSIPSAQTWHRDNHQLLWQARPHEAGIMVFVQHRGPG